MRHTTRGASNAATRCVQCTVEHAMLRATCNWTANGASLPIAPHGCGVPWQGRSCAPTGSPFRLFAMQQTTYNVEQTTSNRQRTTYSGRHAPITSPFSALALLHGTAACLSTRCRPRPCRDSLHGPWSAAARASASSCRRVACGGAVHGRGHLPALRMAAWSVAQCPRRRDRQRATDNVRQTTCGRQRAADNVRRTTCNRQRVADNVRQATCGRQRAADNVQSLHVAAPSRRATFDVQDVARALAQKDNPTHDLLRITCTIQHAPCNLRRREHAPFGICSVRPCLHLTTCIRHAACNNASCGAAGHRAPVFEWADNGCAIMQPYFDVRWSPQLRLLSLYQCRS